MRRWQISTLLLGLLVGLGGIFVAPARCLACTCAMPSDPATAREQATAVFQGRVIAINPEVTAAGYRYQRVAFQVDTNWKGSVARETIVYTGSGGGDCGYPFQVGTGYLVYAFATHASGPSQDLPAGALATGSCNRTRPLAEAGDDPAALGPGTSVVDTSLPNLPDTGAGYAARRPLPSLLAPLALILLTSVLLGAVGLRRRMA